LRSWIRSLADAGFVEPEGAGLGGRAGGAAVGRAAVGRAALGGAEAPGRALGSTAIPSLAAAGALAGGACSSAGALVNAGVVEGGAGDGLARKYPPARTPTNASANAASQVDREDSRARDACDDVIAVTGAAT
jgi:hypothetical protein